MIKVGIIGCSDLHSAELIRILINHPDVEMRWVCDSRHAGERLDHIIPGIVGECDLVVGDEAGLDNIDLLYLCGSREEVAVQLSSLQLPDELRVIDLSGSHNLSQGGDTSWTYGMCEMQRRVMVHEAHWVTIPGNAATATLLALLPMARNLLLNSPLTAHVAIGTSDWPRNNHSNAVEQWQQEQQREVALALGECQSSFNQPVELTIAPLAERRTLAAAVRFKCGVDGETVRQLYEQYYEDHNFVFLTDRPIVSADVENTNKCLLTLDKDEHSGLLTVHAVMDVLLKGGAGMAVHAMNLLFGLHERTGMLLKGTGC